MKKHINFFVAAFLGLTLSACNFGGSSTSSEISSSASSEISTSLTTSSSETTSSVDNSSTSSISSSSSTSSSSSSSSSSVEQPKDVKIGERYTSNTWDITIKNMLEMVIGDQASKIPEFISTRYEAVMGYTEQDGPLTFQITCYGANANSATRIYKEKMEEKGFYFSAENNYGYQMVDYYSDLFLGFNIVSENVEVPYFVIQTNIQQTRESEWNTNIVNLYTDLDNVPACPAQSYQTTYDSSKDTLSVFALFVDKTTVVSKYMSELVKAGFTSKGTDNYGATTMVDPSGYVSVVLYLTYGDYDCDALYINFVNVWPAVGIASFTSISQFPKLVSDIAKYDGYTYLNLGTEENPDYRICIYYINASSTDYEGYIDDLMTYGFSKQNVEVSETNIVSTYLNMVYEYQDGPYKDNLILTIRVLYQISSNTICLVIEKAGYLI